MRAIQIAKIEQAVENEGFHYTFNEWDELPGIEDERFITLVKSYREAAFDLKAYLNLRDS